MANFLPKIISTGMQKSIIKITLAAIFLISLLGSCGVRPQYKTAKGKKKNRYYNSIQYHQEPFKAPNR
jgi:hypothetical protein